jgi:hypothetical protein
MEQPQQLSPMWKPYAEAARETGVRLTRAALAPGRSGRRIDDLVKRLHRELEAMTSQAFDALPGGGPACAAGCDHCCRTLRVTASPVEIFGLSHRLDLGGNPDPELRDRILHAADECVTRATDEPGAPLTWRGRSACPLLANGLCLAYSTRPAACRGCVSADAALCERCATADDEGLIPGSVAHQLGAAAIIKGATDALDTLGLCGRPVELRFALGLVLRMEDAEKRWLRGEDVFSPR